MMVQSASLLEPSQYKNTPRPCNLNNNVKPATTTCLRQQPSQDRGKLDAQQHSEFCATMGQLIWANLDRPDLMFAAKLHSGDGCVALEKHSDHIFQTTSSLLRVVCPNDLPTALTCREEA